MYCFRQFSIWSEKKITKSIPTKGKNKTKQNKKKKQTKEKTKTKTKKQKQNKTKQKQNKKPYKGKLLIELFKE